MIKNQLASIFLAISILFLACGNESGGEKEKSILSGRISSTLLKEFYLIDLLRPNAGPIDTAKIAEDGSFAFDYKPKMKGFYRVNLNEQYGLVLPLSADEEVKILGDAYQLELAQITGSKDAVRMKELNDFLQIINAKSRDLQQQFQQYANSPKRDSILMVFRTKLMAIESERTTKLKELIDQDASLFSNLAVIEQMPKDDTEYYQKVDDALSKEYANSPYYQNFHAKVLEISRFAVGTAVPEINLPDPNGNLVPLSSLRGKVVLIDFWASWCKPCRQENPNVVRAYQQYKDKGFTVYGVSLDRNKDAWVNAIAQDNLNWTQVSDLKFWSSEAAKAYGVSSIPFALLIDKEGKVLGKNLRGAALQQKLAEVL